LTRGNYNSKVDVFAVGCLLAELLFCCNSGNFHRRPNQENSYLQSRWLFPSRSFDQTRLKPFEQILPILKHAVFDEEDIEHPYPNRARLTVTACERLSEERSTGFDRETMLRCSKECFEFQDLSERYANPSNLDEEELSIFIQLRNVLRGCLAFDPTRRLSSHQALEVLTGRIHHYATMPSQSLEEIKLVELAVQNAEPEKLELRRQFIKHCPAIGQLSPVAEILGAAP
jgi:serine/threonine protein kinase